MCILVIGDVMIDHYILGNCDRISPEAPVPVVLFQEDLSLLGGAGNVVRNLSALGCNVDLLSIGGNDNNYEIISNRLKELSCNTDSFFMVDDRPTTIKTRVLANRHQLVRIDRENCKPINSSTQSIIIDWLNSNIYRYKIVLISDYNKGLLTEELLQIIIYLCNRYSITTILDPKLKDFKSYKGVSYIKPNRREAEDATGIVIRTEVDILNACMKVQEITACNAVFLTLSADGIALYMNGGIKIFPAIVHDIIDVTGAGDTVLASLGYCLLNNKSLPEACMFANKAASIVIQKVGSATASIDEVLI